MYDMVAVRALDLVWSRLERGTWNLLWMQIMKLLTHDV